MEDGGRYFGGLWMGFGGWRVGRGKLVWIDLMVDRILVVGGFKRFMRGVDGVEFLFCRFVIIWGRVFVV